MNLDDLCIKAEKLVENGELESALKIFKKIIIKDPKFWRAITSLVKTLSKLGRYDEALEIVNRSINKEHPSIEGLLCLALLHSNTGMYKEGLKVLEQALQLDSSNQEVLKEKANIHYLLGQLQDALTCFDTLLEINPENTEIRIEREKVLRAINAKEQGKESLKQLISKAESLENENLLQDALNVYKEAQKYDMLNMDVNQRIKRLISELDKKKREEEEKLRVDQDKQHTPTVTRYGSTRSSIGRDYLDNIMDQLANFTSIKRSEAINIFNRGNSYAMKKNYKKAIKYHKKAVDIDPLFSDGWANLGADYMGINDLENALSCFNTSLKINPYNNKIWDNKGLVLIYQKKFEEALECFIKALNININDPIAKQNRLYILNQLKKTDFVSAFMREFMEPSPEEIHNATKDLKSTQKQVNPKEIAELEVNAEKLIYDGDFEDVIVLCDKLLEIDPNSSMGWFWKGKAFSALAKDEKAINCYAKSYDLKKWITSQSNYIYAKSRLSGKSSKDLMRKMEKPPQSHSPLQSADSWNAQGAYAQTLGAFEEALYCFDKALDFNNEHLLAKRNKNRVIELLKEEGYR